MKERGGEGGPISPVKGKGLGGYSTQKDRGKVCGMRVRGEEMKHWYTIGRVQYKSELNELTSFTLLYMHILCHKMYVIQAVNCNPPLINPATHNMSLSAINLIPCA